MEDGCYRAEDEVGDAVPVMIRSRRCSAACKNAVEIVGERRSNVESNHPPPEVVPCTNRDGRNAWIAV